MILSENKQTNTQAEIIRQFDELFTVTGKVVLDSSFAEIVYQIKKQAPTRAFAIQYIRNAEQFLKTVKAYRDREVENFRLERKAV